MGDHDRSPLTAPGWRAALSVLALLALAGCAQTESGRPSTPTPFPSPGTGPWDERDLAVYREAIQVLRERERTPPIVLDVEPVLIKAFQDNAAEVVVRRCVEPPGAPAGERLVQEVVVRRYENRVWRIGPFTTTGESC